MFDDCSGISFQKSPEFPGFQRCPVQHFEHSLQFDNLTPSPNQPGIKSPCRHVNGTTDYPPCCTIGVLESKNMILCARPSVYIVQTRRPDRRASFFNVLFILYIRRILRARNKTLGLQNISNPEKHACFHNCVYDRFYNCFHQLFYNYLGPSEFKFQISNSNQNSNAHSNQNPNSNI